MECSKTPKGLETRSSESENSDDEIIEKTLWPIHQPVYADSKGFDNKDPDYDVQNSAKNASSNNDEEKAELEGTGDKENFELTAESGDNSDAEEVFVKAPRGRMKFPCSQPECKSSPTKSSLNGHSNSSCEDSLHKSKSSTTKVNHQGPSEDNTILQSNSEATKKKTFCHLN